MGGSGLRYPRWQEPVLLAVEETNPARQPESIAIAETAICLRRGQLAESKGTGDEIIALQEGISTLQMLRRVALIRSHGL
jgi:hypothetical protein